MSLPPPSPDLVRANQLCDPGGLPEGARLGGLKRLLLRALSVYTRGQVSWNGAVVRVLNALDARVARLAEEAREQALVAEERLRKTAGALEEREARLEEAHTAATRELAGHAEAISARAAALDALAGDLAGRFAEIEREEPTVRRLLEWSTVPSMLVADPPFGEKELEEARALVAEVAREVGEGPFTTYFRVSEERYAHTFAAARAVLPKGARLLDVGNAPGHCAIGLVRLGHSVKGLNLSASWLSTYPSEAWARAFDAVSHDVEKSPLPFDEATFDGVVFTEVLEHIATRDPVWILSELRRVLKPGGVVLFSTPNVCNLSNVIALLRGRNIFWKREQFYGSVDRHNREFTVDEVEEVFAAAGFERRALWGMNDHANWRDGGNEFAYSFVARYGDAHPLTRNTIMGVYKKPLQPSSPAAR
ncbi:MAG: class I SAM-dependent methyltransferase [Acidobacteria bacterium]|nr:class I SAM-dependent methyltransferase [Acidobacteriota bacterium]